jgi:hypothetical protein
MSSNGEDNDGNPRGAGKLNPLEQIASTLADLKQSVDELKTEVRTGEARIHEVWSRLDVLETGGGHDGVHDLSQQFSGARLHDPDYNATAGGNSGVTDSIDLNTASDTVLFHEFLALKDALQKYRLAEHLMTGDTGVLRGDGPRAKAAVLRKSASYVTTAFRFMRAIERPSGPNNDDMHTMYLLLLSHIRMIQYELGVCMVEGSGIPKETTSMFRVIRGGNPNLRDGDTLALEHACRMTEAANRVNEKTQQGHQFRGGFRGRGYNNYNRGGSNFRGHFRGNRGQSYNTYPPKSQDYFASSVDSTASSKP